MKTVSIGKQITLKQLENIAKSTFGNLVKAVVDIKKEIMVIGAELHADEEALLLKKGSKQQDLWGINIYPKMSKKDRIEFDSMINIRPSQNNLERGITDTKIRSKVISIVNKLLVK